MVTARIRTPGVIGKVSVSGAVRTTIADPKFKPKPNVALIELTDTSVSSPQNGDVVTYDSVQGKFVNQQLGDVAVIPTAINGGSF
jgi:hypothetical protein